jgi:hypothetical protein
MDYTWEQLREELNNTTSGGKRKRSSSSVLEEDESFIDEVDPLDGGMLALIFILMYRST